MSAFAGLPDQPYAARLLDAALERPAHAYLLSGPAGSGKRRYADRFATAILDAEPGRVERRTHPDLFVLEPEGQGILSRALAGSAATCTCALTRPPAASTSSSTPICFETSRRTPF